MGSQYISWRELKPEEIIKVVELSEAFSDAWASDTAFPGSVFAWSQNNRAVGQCAVSSLIVQGELGGEIHKDATLSHYWNVLASGAIVDVTRQQFEDDIDIHDEGVVNRNEILTGTSADNASTKSRFEILKNRVHDRLGHVGPNIILLSSNAQPEYIEDALECIALPTGSLHHFRYRKKYVDPPLWYSLPVTRVSNQNLLRNVSVVIGYLNQSRIADNQYNWNNLLSLRVGKIRECFRTGDDENSVAHFYFEVGQSLVDVGNSDSILRSLFAERVGEKYCILSFADIKKIGKTSSPSEVFETQCEQLKAIGLRYSRNDGVIEYEPPLMMLIEGLFAQRWIQHNGIVPPEYNGYGPLTTHVMHEAGNYFLRIRTYNWDLRNTYKVVLNVPNGLFSTPSKYCLNIHSNYDSESWKLTPTFVPHNTSGFLELQITSDRQFKSVEQTLTNLDWRILLMVDVRHLKTLRVLDFVSTFLFFLGPAYLAIVKLVDEFVSKPSFSNSLFFTQWYWFVGGIYFVWFISTAIRRIIRTD